MNSVPAAGRPGGLELVAAVLVAFGVGSAAVATTSFALLASGALLVVAAAYLSLRSVRWAWCVYFFCICANGAAVGIFGLTVRPEYIAAPLFVVALYAHAVRDGRLTPGRMLSAAVYVGLGGWSAVAAISSALVAPDAGASLRMFIQLAVALLAFIPLCLIRLDLRFLVQSGTAILGAISVGSLLYFALDPSRRVSGLAFEYNIMGCLCAGWIGVLFYFARDRAIVTPRIVAMGAPIVLALLLTSTRSAWLALAFVLAYWMMRNLTRRPLTCIGIAIASVVAIVVLQEMYYRVGDQDTWLWRLVHIADFDSGTGAYRLTIWTDAVTQIGNRGIDILVGTGLNTFAQFNPVDPTNVSAAYLSSLWLGLLFDVGVLGSLFFLVFVVAVFTSIDDKWRALPLFVALATCASITNVVWFAFPWTMIALVVNSALSEREPPAEPTTRRAKGNRRRHRAKVLR